jgi:hypothetical protein
MRDPEGELRAAGWICTLRPETMPVWFKTQRKAAFSHLTGDDHDNLFALEDIT